MTSNLARPLVTQRDDWDLTSAGRTRVRPGTRTTSPPVSLALPFPRPARPSSSGRQTSSYLRRLTSRAAAGPRRRIEWERRSVLGPRGCLPQTAPGDSEPWSATVGRHRSPAAYLGSDTDTSRRRRWRVTTTQWYVTGVMVAKADAIFFCRILFVVGVVIR